MSYSSFQPASPETPSVRSNFTTTTTERDFESELALDGEGDEPLGEVSSDAVHFCLLAEFDIDQGATLAHQYPYPTGTDEHRLAELMLPDGAHLRPEDWTVFYLGQTASSAVAPMLSHESSIRLSSESTIPPDQRATIVGDTPMRGVAGGGLLYVLNCVRMKEDKSMRRGAMVKALAICSPYPFIGVFKPLLLLALEEYLVNPTPEILARLYDSANSMPLAGMPEFTRTEKLLLRSNERRDIFEEYFPSHREQEEIETFDDAASTLSSVQTHGSGGNPQVHRAASGGSQGHGYLAPPVNIEGRSAPDLRKGLPKDTHFYETYANFQKITVPIRIPLTVFEEEIGDYSLIELIQTFSAPHPPFPAPYHPYLHTNGPSTHPVILILNALLANKRVIFLGYGLPANQVSRMVLAAVALVTGCGQVLRGFTESTFPYANLTSLDILAEFDGFIAGVTNPRFEELPTRWDVLCNIETGKLSVSKELKVGGGGNGYGAGVVGSMKSGKSSDTSLTNSVIKVGEDDGVANTPQAKMSASSKVDCMDNAFMEDILAAMASHYGESHVRLRFTDYIFRFVRLAAHQEYTQMGHTKIGWPSRAYKDGVLGCGVVFADEATRLREMSMNTHRIDAWRKTRSYKLYTKDWERHARTRVLSFDAQHMMARLRVGRNVSDAEMGEIMYALVMEIGTYEQVSELMLYCPPHWGGLVPIANGLFHRNSDVRDYTIELLMSLHQYPIGRRAIASMNYLHRKALLAHLELREIQHDYDDLRTVGSPAFSHASDMASPETVTNSPQEYPHS